MVMSLKPRSTAMEMTAAGIEVEKVMPAFRPKNTFAAVNTSVITTPRIIPRRVNSRSDLIVAMDRLSPSDFYVLLGLAELEDELIRHAPHRRIEDVEGTFV